MKKENVEKVQNAGEIVDVVSGILAIASPIFSGIPIITFAINRVVGYISEENIIKRLKKLENKLNYKKITIDEFKEKVFQLSEHNEYVIRNNLNNILLNCIPEVADIYIEAVIDLINKKTLYMKSCVK